MTYNIRTFKGYHHIPQLIECPPPHLSILVLSYTLIHGAEALPALVTWVTRCFGMEYFMKYIALYA